MLKLFKNKDIFFKVDFFDFRHFHLTIITELFREVSAEKFDINTSQLTVL